MPKRTFSQISYVSAGKIAKKRKVMSIPRTKKFITGRTLRANMRYAEGVTVTSAAVSKTVGTHVFSANGLYDPNYTGIGHQPRGFDQLMALYDHYTVTNARITVRFTNVGQGRPYVGILIRDNTTAMVEMKDLFEYSDKKMSLKPMARGGTSQTGEMGASISTSVNIAKFLGRSNAMSDPELKGTLLNNPDEGVFFHVVVVDPVQSVANEVSAIVEISYDVVFHEPKLPSSS